MNEVLVKKSADINISDSVNYKGNPKTFHLDEINDTNQELIVLYMYILPKFQTHGIKVGMTKCRIDETFWHCIKSRIKNQKNELALTEEQYDKYGSVREVIYWGVCLDAHNESFKDYKVHDMILSKLAGLTEKTQEWFLGAAPDELVDIFLECRKDDTNNELDAARMSLRMIWGNHLIKYRETKKCKF